MLSKDEVLANPIEVMQSFYTQNGPEKLFTAVHDAKNEFPQFVEGILKGDFSELPCVGACASVDDLLKLHHKLVRFDCVVTDIYEEEFFVPILPAADGKTLVFKYFSDLSEEQTSKYTMATEIDGKSAMSRGNMLGSSLSHLMSPWAAGA